MVNTGWKIEGNSLMALIKLRLLASDSVARNGCNGFNESNGFQVEIVHSFEALAEETGGSIIILSQKKMRWNLSELGVTLPVLVLVDDAGWNHGGTLAQKPFLFLLDSHSHQSVVQRTIELLNRMQTQQKEIAALNKRIGAIQREIDIFNHIGMALGAEQNIDRLLDLILTYARQITVADSGSIYILREDRENQCMVKQTLVFSKTQSDTLSQPFQNAEMPVSDKSIAGSVALQRSVINLEDVYDIPQNSIFHFNPDFDRSINYRSKSMLTLPLCNNENEVIGVLQLINKKKKAGQSLHPITLVDSEVIPFTARDEERALALGGLAAVALENSLLYHEIELLFEGFVRACVNAIESRDPVTSGHSERVTQITLALAEAVHHTTEGPYADVGFTDEQMRELQYAGLLHDIGKIGVREAVLNKKEKLFPGEFRTLRQRFETIRASVHLEKEKKRMAVLLQEGIERYEESCSALDQQYTETLNEIDRIWKLLDILNRQGMVSDAPIDDLPAIAARTYDPGDGRKCNFLTPREVECLSIPKGNLTNAELAEIQLHIVHTRSFLEKIPWSRGLHDVTEIACGHHEMLDGSGYPRGVKEAELPLQARIMAIADIFDALTATDRPYKKAMPFEQVISILEMEAQNGRLDAELVRIFKVNHIHEQIGLQNTRIREWTQTGLSPLRR
ncbi:MAG: HD domain-containing protein [Candidatus Omnitrophota bacterium]|jgi:HD-GYP domain-containing protein (c-di-GMP phosphodiesterase class II)|nr:MAG: HD domain-containing protein [Candidatus Omnitrophota bacterium]